MTATLVKEAKPPAVGMADQTARQAPWPDHRPGLRPPRPAPARRARRLPRGLLRGAQLLRRLRQPVRGRRQLHRDVPRPGHAQGRTQQRHLGRRRADAAHRARPGARGPGREDPLVTAFKLLLFMPMAVSSGCWHHLPAAYDEDPDKGVLNAAVVGVHDAFEGTSPHPTALTAEASPRVPTARTVPRLRLARPHGRPRPRRCCPGPAEGREARLRGRRAEGGPGRAARRRLPGLHTRRGREQGQVDRGERTARDEGRGGARRGDGREHHQPRPTAPSASRAWHPAPDTVRLPASNFSPPYEGVSWSVRRWSPPPSSAPTCGSGPASPWC